MHAVIDSERRERNRRVGAIKQNQELAKDATRRETKDAGLVGKKGITNAERQRGRALTAETFMKKLRSINTDLVLLPHPRQKEIKFLSSTVCLYLTLPDGKREFIISFEEGEIPEWSIFGTQRVRDYHGQWVEVPHREIKRGWRTVLIRLLHKGLLNLSDTERVFGPGDRESWKVLTGKGTGVLPI